MKHRHRFLVELVWDDRDGPPPQRPPGEYHVSTAIGHGLHMHTPIRWVNHDDHSFIARCEACGWEQLEGDEQQVKTASLKHLRGEHPDAHVEMPHHVKVTQT